MIAGENMQLISLYLSYYSLSSKKQAELEFLSNHFRFGRYSVQGFAFVFRMPLFAEGIFARMERDGKTVKLQFVHKRSRENTSR